VFLPPPANFCPVEPDILALVPSPPRVLVLPFRSPRLVRLAMPRSLVPIPILVLVTFVLLPTPKMLVALVRAPSDHTHLRVRTTWFVRQQVLPLTLANPLVFVLPQFLATSKLLRANALEPPLPALATIALPKDSPWSTALPLPAVARYTTGMLAPCQRKCQTVVFIPAAKLKPLPQRAVFRVALPPVPKT
jgi:hypothetical protein